MPASAGPRTSCRSCSGGAIVASSQSSTVSRPRSVEAQVVAADVGVAEHQRSAVAPDGPRSASRRSSWASTSSARGRTLSRSARWPGRAAGVEPLERGQTLAQVGLEARLERVARRQQAGQRRRRGVDRGQRAAELGRERRRPLRPGRRRAADHEREERDRLVGVATPPARPDGSGAGPGRATPRRSRATSSGSVASSRAAAARPAPVSGQSLRKRRRPRRVRDDVAGRRVADRDELERGGREAVGVADRLGQRAAVDRRLVLHRRGAPILGCAGRGGPTLARGLRGPPRGGVRRRERRVPWTGLRTSSRTCRSSARTTSSSRPSTTWTAASSS